MLVDMKPEQIRIPFSIVIDGAVVFNDAFMLTTEEYALFTADDLNAMAEVRYVNWKAVVDAASSDPGQTDQGA